MQGKLCSFSTPMRANFTQPRSSSALTSNALLAAFLHSGEMQLLMEVMLTEEKVLAQIAWDICRGFLNVKGETTTWILCKMWEHHLQTLVLGSGDAYCKQALICSTCWPGVPLTIRTVSNMPIVRMIASFLNVGAFLWFAQTPFAQGSGILGG